MDVDGGTYLSFKVVVVVVVVVLAITRYPWIPAIPRVWVGYSHGSEFQTPYPYLHNPRPEHRGYSHTCAKPYLLLDQCSICPIDCWSVHHSAEFLDWMWDAHCTIIVIFIPAGCTGLFSHVMSEFSIPSNIPSKDQHMKILQINSFINLRKAPPHR
jgi:hypothetical protein